jgi:hypothetical protein
MTLDRCFVLTPYNPDESMALKEAAKRADRSEMHLDGELAAFDRYLQGDRENSIIVAYFRKFGLTPEKPGDCRFSCSSPL